MSTRRIYLIGPSSTGKTTLCNAITKHLSLPPSVHVAEVARNVIRAGGWSRQDIGLLEMQQKILDAHAEKEREVIERQGLLNDVDDNSGGIQLLCDRSAIDPVVYAVLTSRSILEPHSSVDELERSRRDALVNSSSFQAILPTYLEAASHFYLLEPVDSWLEDDGFRHTGDQAESFVIFKRLLGELGIPYRLIGRDMLDLEERVRFVLGSGGNSEEVSGRQR
ncbi:hypothetical protein AAF712_014719 [Marasmius tenuissimus]|uniref:NadR/Ttd14 AAA domain-containing protein n=1 Tax=Marasmius tenuissimus TaxID=585030 RepID=A0ABR2ZBB7_9AGAR|nr:hypothetical protein PM082_006544 [Marasmius tenuissimus]